MKKFIEDWQNFVENSCDMLANTTHNTRISLKYRNKPARGKLSVTNSNKVKLSINSYFNYQSFRYEFKDTKSIDKLDEFTNKFLHLLANKPLVEQQSREMDIEKSIKKDDKKAKGGKGKKKN